MVRSYAIGVSVPSAVADSAHRFLADFWRLQPVEATRAGIRAEDARLPDLSPDGLGHVAAWRAEMRSALSNLPQPDLTPDDEIDRRVLLGVLAADEVRDDWRWYQRAPAAYVEQAMAGLHALLARPALSASPDERADALVARLDGVPRLLADGRANLRPELIPSAFVDIALVATDGAQRFLGALDQPDRRVESARARALQSVADYAAFLRHDVTPEGSFALGSDLYGRLLREQHYLDLTPDAIFDYGRQLADELVSRMVDLAGRSGSGSGDAWHAQIEALKADHPTAETLLQTYADESARARAFVLDRHLVPLPAGETFEVRPTAPFLRATMPLGHFDKTPPFATDDNLGILYITPIDTSQPGERQNELLSAHCFTAVRAIALHETVPGHHLQLWHAKLRGSPVRKQFPSTLFSEGWALYCEELMEEAGYYDTPGLSLWRLKNALWRAARLMVDVGLHCRGLDIDVAAQPLIDLGGLEPHTARGEALRYTTSPTQPSSYVLGRDRFVELRRQHERRPDFRLDAFHDWVLGYSSVAPALIPDVGPGQAA